MVKKRLITALCGLPLVIAAVWFDRPLPWFTVLATVWGLLAAYEFYRLVAAAKVPPLVYFGLVFNLLFIVSRNADFIAIIEPFFTTDILVLLLLGLLVVLPLIWLLLRRRVDHLGIRWAWTVAGVLYLGWLLGYFVALRGLVDGRNWVFYALFVIFAYDTGAFFIGRSIGRHKLAPKISPGKTWEGVLGGLAVAIVISLLFTLNTPLSVPLAWWQAVAMGVLVSIFGQFGDLAESLFKRIVGVKDSGTALPGHGGFLDRIDSVVFAGVVVYYCVVWGIQ